MDGGVGNLQETQSIMKISLVFNKPRVSMISRAVGRFGSPGGVKMKSRVEDRWSYAPRHHSETNAK